MGALVPLRSRHGLLLCLLQLLFIVLFAVLTVYHRDADETRADPDHPTDATAHANLYPSECRRGRDHMSREPRWDMIRGMHYAVMRYA